MFRTSLKIEIQHWLVVLQQQMWKMLFSQKISNFCKFVQFYKKCNYCKLMATSFYGKICDFAKSLVQLPAVNWSKHVLWESFVNRSTLSFPKEKYKGKPIVWTTIYFGHFLFKHSVLWKLVLVIFGQITSSFTACKPPNRCSIQKFLMLIFLSYVDLTEAASMSALEKSR